MPSDEPTTLFRPVSAATLDLMTTFNQTQKHTFLMPTKFISVEAGQVGFLLHSYCNLGRGAAEQDTYRSFFANSRYEAMQGAIKIARHKALTLATPEASPAVTLVYDPALELRHLIDPLHLGAKEALIPGLRLVTTRAELEAQLTSILQPLALLLYPGQAAEPLPPDQLNALLQMCRERGVISILCQCDLDLHAEPVPIQQLAVRPDILVTGESLTDYEIPFGAFTMRQAIHQPWAGILDCFTHSSTYAGNTLALTKVRQIMLERVTAFRTQPAYANRCAQIATDDESRRAAFAAFVNPGLVTIYGLTGLDVHPQTASGSLLTVKRGDETRTLIDCVTGGGAVARGHNPDDIVAEVFQRHQAEHDYWSDLAATLSTFTLPHAFPAVSGATAVDIGLTLAMLASNPRRKLVVFKKNYAGKTLLALNATRDEDAYLPFLPLYAHTVCLDPLAAETPATLTALLTSGEVALVWFELIQGDNKHMLPQPILDIINQYQAVGGYFIGVDEILMGLYRTGQLLSHQGVIAEPDIITLAKPLSDGVFPMAVTMISDRLYQQAVQHHPQTVRFLAERYRNQLGSHIALHVLEKLRDPAFIAQMNEVAATLATGMAEVSTAAPLIRELSGRGHIYQFSYHPVTPHKPEPEFFLVLYMCSYLIEHADTFLFFDSFSPPLNLSQAQAELLVHKLKQALARDPEVILAGYEAFLDSILVHLGGDQ